MTIRPPTQNSEKGKALNFKNKKMVLEIASQAPFKMDQRKMFTRGLKRSHTSTVKMVPLLLNTEERDDIRAAIITAIINPTNPIGNTLRTNLKKHQTRETKKIAYMKQVLSSLHSSEQSPLDTMDEGKYLRPAKRIRSLKL